MKALACMPSAGSRCRTESVSSNRQAFDFNPCVRYQLFSRERRTGRQTIGRKIAQQLGLSGRQVTLGNRLVLAILHRQAY